MAHEDKEGEIVKHVPIESHAHKPPPQLLLPELGVAPWEGAEGSAGDQEEPRPQNQGITSKRLFRRA